MTSKVGRNPRMCSGSRIKKKKKEYQVSISLWSIVLNAADGSRNSFTRNSCTSDLFLLGLVLFGTCEESYLFVAAGLC